MVSFNVLATAFAAFAAVSEATYHGHVAKRHLHMRASYGNITDIPNLLGTGGPAPVPVPTSTVVADIPEPDYTTTLTSTVTKSLTVTYTLGNGKEVVTTITKLEETTKTIAHVKATLTVSPVIESTPGVPSVPASSTVAPVPVVPYNSGSSRTSTTTQYVTAPASGTLTVAAASSAPACPSVETVYLPTYITVYNTVTAAPPVPSTNNSEKAPDQSTTSRTTTRTSTTTVSVFKTVTLTKPPYSTGY